MKLNKKMDLENFDYISYSHCTFCYSSHVNKILTLHLNPEVNYFFCKDCKVSYTDKQLSEKSTQELYSNYYDDHSLKTGIESNVLGEHLFRFFSSKKMQTSTIRILDFGGGDGSIAKYLGEKLRNNKLCEIYSIDVFDVYECEHKIKDIHYFTSEEDIKSNTYDIVIASAVLEHLNAPMAKLLLLFNAMKSKGYFYARTPYRLPIKMFLMNLKIKKVGMQFPWHLFDMGRPFWESLPKLFLTRHDIKINVVKSRPSIVQTTFKEHKKKYLFSKILKAPAYLFKNWNLVGGWEVFIEKI